MAGGQSARRSSRALPPELQRKLESIQAARAVSSAGGSVRAATRPGVIPRRPAPEVRQALDFGISKDAPVDHERPRLVHGFDRPIPSAAVALLSSLPLAEQEQSLVEDLLSVLMAMPSRYITLAVNHCSLEIVFNKEATSGADAGLLTLTSRFFPIARDYFSVLKACEKARWMDCETGTTRNAMGAALRSYLCEYRETIPELEVALNAGRLSMQRLWFLVRPAARQLAFLAKVVREVGSLRGSSIIAALEQMKPTVDEENQDILDRLCKEGARPVIDFVLQWISFGIIDDPFQEFFLEENKAYTVANLAEDYESNYWGRRYLLRTDKIPLSLEPYAERILRIGKYINVFRECSTLPKVITLEEAEAIETLSDLISKVDSAVELVSKRLLDYFRESVDILQRLQSMRSFFLAAHADYVINFLSSARGSFEVGVSSAATTTLESFLEDAVRSSSLSSDVYREQVSCQVLPSSLLNQLLRILGESPDAEPVVSQSKVSEGFTLTLAAPWPASLVLSCKSLTKYQLLFRYILRCRLVEQDLNKSWLSLYKSVRCGRSRRPILSKALLLLRRMHSFVERSLRFMNVEVLEPRWIEMERLVSKAQSLDEVIQFHDDFLDTCLKGCMLTNSKLFRIMIRLQTTCTAFSKIIERHHLDMARSKPDERGFVVNLNKAEMTFDKYLLQLIEALGTYSVLEGDPNLSVFCSWLDYNDFYASSANSTC